MESQLLQHFLSLKDSAINLQKVYHTARPFSHIIIDDFLPEIIAEKVLSLFPDRDFVDFNQPDYKKFQKKKLGQIQKSYFINIDPWLRYVLYEFNSMAFLDYLENLTGIKGLIPDPHYEGGAFHSSLPGGKLAIHADFNVDRKRKLRRCLNVLLYFNKDWKDSYNGHLELWDEQMRECQVKIAPIFNRCVIFNTTSTSYHGHPIPLSCPENRTRKSIALYYYVADAGIFNKNIKAHSTLWKSTAAEEQKTIGGFISSIFKRKRT